MFSRIKFFLKCVIAGLALLFPAASFAMSTTNVQPGNLVQNNRTTASATFTTAVTLPSTGKVKITFPVGYDVSGVTSGACSTLNGALSTSISGQTITLTRDGSGSAELAGAQTCTLTGVKNPSATGASGTYIIQITDANDTILDQDIAVASDTIIAPGTIITANVQPENQVEGAISLQTISYTSLNSLPADGRIQVEFPAGYDVSGAYAPTCSTMDDGFSVTTTGQIVTILRGGSGTAQAAGAETCTIRGIKAPPAGTPAGTYQIRTQDSLGNTTDAITTVPADPFFTAPNLTSTNVQPASLVAGATSVATVSFTTATTTPIGAKVRVTFPTGFATSPVTSVACSSYLGTETFTTSTNSVDIILALATGEAAAAETCTITSVRNPMISGSTGTYTIEVLDESAPGNIISSDGAVTADTLTSGVLTATDVAPENLVVSSTQLHTIVFTTANPLAADGRIVITYPSGFDTSLANGASCVGINGSVITTTSTNQVILTRSGGTSTASSQTIECVIRDVRNRNSAGSSGTYTITTTNSLGTTIDNATAAADTYINPVALTTLNVQPVSLVQNAVNDHDITFTSSVAIPQEARITVQYGVGYSLSGATSGTCTGFDGSISTTSSSGVVTLARGANGTTVVSGAKACRIFGIMNPASTGSTGIYTINILDKTGIILGTGTTTADVITTPGTLTSTDVQLGSLQAGATTTATLLFTYANGFPSDGRIQLDFPSGFQTTGASQVTCAGINGGEIVTTSGTQVIIITRDGSAAGTASGSASCTVTSVKNRVASGSTGTYSLSLRDSANTILSSATVAADTLTAGALEHVDVTPDTLLIQATSSYQLVFTTNNILPENGKIKILFPAGFDVSQVSASGMSCPSLNGVITTSVSGQTVIGTRSGGTATRENASVACGVSGVRSPLSPGLAGTYTLQTSDALDATIEQLSGITGDTFAASGVLSSANVIPGNFRLNELTNHTIDFTQSLGIPRDGSIQITYPSGFTVSAANSGSCTGMDGTFVTSVSGTTVILNRTGGTGKQGGSETCQIYTLLNPGSPGQAGTYTIATYTGLGQLIEQDTSVTSDSFANDFSGTSSGGSGGGGGGMFFPLPSTNQSTQDGSILTLIAMRVARLPVPIHQLVKLIDDGNPKTQEDSAVYYVGADGLRHAFFDLHVYNTWYCDFSGVKTLSAAELASISLGKNVPYRPGVKLVKFTTDPKVYAVLKSGVLAPIPDENFAKALYGEQWNKMIHDLPDTAYTDYTFATVIPSLTELTPSLQQKSVLYPSDSLSVPGYQALTSQTGFTCSTPLSVSPASAFTRPASIPNDFQFSQTLSVSSSPSSEVRYLQLILAALGTSIYPEQRITGTFGPATEQAVKRFQAKTGLPQTGAVGEQTRSQLNTLLDK